MDKFSSSRASLLLSGLLIVLAIAFHSTTSPLLSQWLKFDQALSHGLPTFGIFIFLLWKINAESIERDRPGVVWGLSLALGILSFAWYLFETINLQIACIILILAIYTLYVASSFSFSTARQLFPIIAIFFFAIPIWSELTDVLVQLSSLVVGKFVEGMGITVLIEGNNILIPSGVIQIAEGCSGLRYLTISLLLTYTICLINGYNLRQSILALVVGCFLGLLTNWIRIGSLVIIGYETNMQSSLMHDHEMFGWFLFALVILPALYFAPLLQKHISFTIDIPRCKPIIPTLFLLIGPTLSLFSERHADYSNTLTLEQFNLSHSVARDINMIELPFPKSVSVSSGILAQDNIEIKMTLAKSTARPENKKLVPYIGSILDKSEWVEVDQKAVTVDGENFNLITLKKVSSMQQSLLMYQFNVGKNTTGSYREAKLLQLKARFLGQDFFGLLTMQANCASRCENEIVAFTKAAGQWHLSKTNQKH